MNNSDTRCGFAAIVGRPNVGKSTLLNRILGEKISIVTPKPQTTRHRIIGVKKHNSTQILFVDTPGIQLQGKKAIDRVMNRSAEQSILDADVILFITEFGMWKESDQGVLDTIKEQRRPCIGVINKIDQVKSRVELLPALQALSQRHEFSAIFPVSAKSGDNLDELIQHIADALPESPWLFPDDTTTDKNEAFLCAEIIREKLMMALQQELPYGLTVEIERWEQGEKQLAISAIIWTERESQKPIIIGHKGALLKQVGTDARKAIAARLGHPVHLQLWTKTRKNWADNARALQSLGYDNQ